MVLAACNPQGSSDPAHQGNAADTTVPVKDTLSAAVGEEVFSPNDGFFPSYDSSYGGDLLGAGGYHWDEVKKGMDRQAWLGVFKSADGAYYVADTRVTIQQDYDPVLDEDSTQASGWLVTPEIQDTTIVLVSKISLQKGLVVPVAIPAYIRDDRMIPGDSLVFRYGGDYSYRLSVTGKKQRIAELDSWNVSDYRMYITAMKAGKLVSQLLINSPHNDDSIPSIIFIGDLDGDQVPDLILNATNNYNAYVPTLYLSKDAGEGQLYRVVAQHVSVGC
ncbi:hypothetical protein CK934_07915 [Chitinophaga sp. MD30]|nr:hypothetical protein CK934_07915 [Chitinophaga sp. MD30]